MNLVSCDNCGIVIDVDKTPFPKYFEFMTEEGIDDTKAMWYNRNYVAAITCPVCTSQIPDKSGD